MTSITFSTSVSPTVSPTSTTTPSVSPNECTLEEIDLIDVFTNWKNILLGIAAAAIVTAPAASVYLRNTTETPKKTYFYSCIVKAIASFFSMSIIVGGIYDFAITNNCKVGDIFVNSSGGIMSVSFPAALVTEVIEFIFDFGRLVIFFGDPGIIDYYQSARWNSNVVEGGGVGANSDGDKCCGRIRCCTVGLSSLPIAALMFFMWILNLISQMVGLFVSEEGETNLFTSIILGYGGLLWGAWMVGIALYLLLSFSCTGAYYLLRMLCPCFYGLENDGEEQGIGFYWAQFKLIAVDVPGLISSIFVNPSSLFLFWTAEFINDTFPTVAEFMVEKSLEEEEEDEEEDVNKGHDEIDHLKSEKDLNGESDTEDLIDLASTTNYQNILIPIHSNRSNKKRIHDAFKIQRDYPSQLVGQMNETEWDGFCDEVDFILESILPLKARKPDRCTKIIFIILGVILSLIYWFIFYVVYNILKRIQTYTNKNGEEGDQETISPLWFYTILFICSMVGIIVCIKLCFGRDLDSESDILQRLESVCNDHSKQSEVLFHLKTKNDISTWIWQGGLSCRKGIDSIKGIECLYKSSLIESENARLAEEACTVKDEAKIREEYYIAEEKARLREEARIADEKARLAEENRIAEERVRLREEARIADKKARLREQARIAEEKARLAEENRIAKENALLAEEARLVDESRIVEEEA